LNYYEKLYLELSLSPLLSCCELRVSSSCDFIVERVRFLERFIARTLSSSTEGIRSRFHVVFPDSFSVVSSASGPVIMFYAPGLILGGTEGVRSYFHVLRSRTRFRRYRVRRVPFSCFARPYSCSAVPRASGHVFMFGAPRLVFDRTKGVGSHFLVWRSRIGFWRYRGRRVPFSCFALPDSFSVVAKASYLIFMFSAPGHVFGGTEGVGSIFHVLRFRTHFRWYRGHRVSFSCFALSDSFSVVPGSSCLFFMFCAPGLIFSGTEGVGFCFHVLRSRTRFRPNRGRRASFSCFALPDSFSAVLSASGPIFKFAPGLALGGTEGVASRFNVLRAQTHFRRYRWRRVPFSCLALPDWFLPVQWASGPVFMFCALGLVFCGTEGVGCRFHVLCC
jgi:hypothetical protein